MIGDESMSKERMRTATSVSISDLTKRYGDTLAVDGLSIEIIAGEMLVLLGPSGCGKTTTMRCIVGLEEAQHGRIMMGDACVFDSTRGISVPVDKRNVGMVFQSYAIWPHKTVFENVAFPLRMHKLSSREIRDRTLQMLALMGLEDLSERGASLLSGGQMQRVALARSVIMEPNVLLLDEPLSNLDAKLRDRLRVEVRRVQQTLGITSVYVTHDQAEALALADRIAIMNRGKIVQLDTPEALYRNPSNRFVADFIGASNLLQGRVLAVQDGMVTVESNVGPTFQVAASGGSGDELQPNDVVSLSVRPESIQVVHDEAAQGLNTVRATVDVELFMGTHISYEMRLSDGSSLRVMDFRLSDGRLPVGEQVTLSLPTDDMRLLK